MAAHDDLATKLVAFSDNDLESCYDDVTAACVASRCLSLSDLDALTDALAAAANRRQAVETQLQMLLTRVRANPYVDQSVEQPAPGQSLADVGLPQTGLTRTGRVDLRPGDEVEIHGLSGRVELNGLSGVVVAPGYDANRGRCAVRVYERDQLPNHVTIRPANLLVIAYDPDESPVSLVRPTTTRAGEDVLEPRSVVWCRTNGFDEVDAAARLWAGPWWADMSREHQARMRTDAARHWVAFFKSSGGGGGASDPSAALAPAPTAAPASPLSLKLPTLPVGKRDEREELKSERSDPTKSRPLSARSSRRGRSSSGGGGGVPAPIPVPVPSDADEGEEDEDDFDDARAHRDAVLDAIEREATDVEVDSDEDLADLADARDRCRGTRDGTAHPVPVEGIRL